MSDDPVNITGMPSAGRVVVGEHAECVAQDHCYVLYCGGCTAVAFGRVADEER